MKINAKYCKTLELDKVLDQLAEYTCCDYAAEMARNLVPSTSLIVVRDEVEKTNEAFYLSSHYGTPSFYKMDDPTSQVKLASAGGILSARVLLNIAAVMRQARMLKEWFAQCENRESSMREIFGLLIPNKSLENRINEVFISEEEISDGASDELMFIRRKMRQLSAKIREDLDKMTRSSAYSKALQENIVTMRDGRYVLPVKAEYKGTVSGLVHDTSASGATLFIEPMSVVEANNDIKVLQSEEKAEIDRILAELSALCGDNASVIEQNFITAISLNLYFAKSSLASNQNAMMPTVTNDGYIKLNKARHPLIPKDKVVPISLELGKEYTSLVVTGPNTGGKTVTLKTIGLLTLMTMCGMLIPVSDDSNISIFESILVDMGDEQSIAQNLSTFSAHMTNVVSILSKADNKSLVLVDELGSGTDPVEGAALATAILEELRQRKTIVAATTHYAELKVYALQTDGVMNASCEFDVKTLRPTYRLLIGTPGRSNAFEISRRIGLTESILEKAAELVASDKQSFEDVVDGLESSRQDFERQSSRLKAEAAELARLKEELRNSNLDAINEKERIIEKARQDARKIVESVKLDSQLIIDELDKLRKEKDKADFSSRAAQAKAQLKGRVDRLHNEANPVVARSNEDYVLPRKLKKGDNVLVVDIDKNGYVLEEPKGASVLVQVGIIKSRVDIGNLRLLDEKKNKQNTSGAKGGVKKTITSNRDAKAMVELDLRGMTVDEAVAEVDMFINKAMLSNMTMATIIHGKGTGALRSAIHSFLRQCKQVKSFRLGVYGEGETGVTIVEFK